MLAALRAALGKDLRLLLRDRVGLIFLTVAPLIVITVAGFSLASLYGAGARGETAYVLPIADEDGGRVGRAIRERLAKEELVQLQPVANREEASAIVRRKEAGVALVIPAGTSHALAAGRAMELQLLTDPVKYLEVANVRALVQELRHGIERKAHERAARRLERLRARMLATRADFQRAADSVARELDALPARLAEAQTEVADRARAAEAGAAREVRAAVAEASELRLAVVSTRLASELVPLRRFVGEIEATEVAFRSWMRALRRQAGRYADRIPPPPELPTIPFAVSELMRLDTDALVARLTGKDAMPAPRITLPRIPTVSAPAIPTLTLPS